MAAVRFNLLQFLLSRKCLVLGHTTSSHVYLACVRVMMLLHIKLMDSALDTVSLRKKTPALLRCPAEGAPVSFIFAIALFGDFWSPVVQCRVLECMCVISYMLHFICHIIYVICYTIFYIVLYVICYNISHIC